MKMTILDLTPFRLDCQRFRVNCSKWCKSYEDILEKATGEEFFLAKNVAMLASLATSRELAT